MAAIEAYRMAALGGHAERFEGCGETRIAYNSCLMGKFRNGELVHDRLGSDTAFRRLLIQIAARHDYRERYARLFGRSLAASAAEKAGVGNLYTGFGPLTPSLMKLRPPDT